MNYHKLIGALLIVTSFYFSWKVFVFTFHIFQFYLFFHGNNFLIDTPQTGFQWLHQTYPLAVIGGFIFSLGILVYLGVFRK